MRRQLRAPWGLLALVALAAATASCERSEIGAPGASLVLISIDTLRSDHLAAYGYEEVATPHIDRLAAESVLFERAYSHCPLTLPSHASIFTGLLPPRHGVRDNKGFELRPEYSTLAERLRDAGYRTRGVVSSMVLRSATGIAQGFEQYDDRMPKRGSRRRTFAQRRGDVAIEVARRWMDELGDGEPFFLFVHLFDPHAPYEAPEPFASRYARAYDAEIAYTDRLVGELLQELEQRGLYDDALIVLLSDHGEGLGDHVEQEHGLTLYREALQVPLLLRLPGAARAGTRLAAPVALVDLLPTVLELLGLPWADLDGRPLLGGPPPDTGRPIYSETLFTRLQYGWSELSSIVLGDLQYIEAPRPELYDLVQDPLERDNLLPGREVPSEMRLALEEVGAGESSMVEIDEETLRQLASLGYVGSTLPPGGDGVLADPKDHLADVEELWALIRRERGTPPEDARVRALLTSVAAGNESLHRASARSLLHHGRARTAYEILMPFADSSDAETCIVLGQAATTLGRFGEAHRHLERAVRLDPTHPEAEMGLGTLLLSEGRFSDALPRLERSVELDPRLADAWNGLGAARIQGGDPGGAIEAWKRATEIDPGFDDPWFNLALVYRQIGDRAAAIEALKRYADLVAGEDKQRALTLLRSLGAG